MIVHVLGSGGEKSQVQSFRRYQFHLGNSQVHQLVVYGLGVYDSHMNGCWSAAHLLVIVRKVHKNKFQISEK